MAEVNKSETTNSERNVQAIMDVIERNENPFQIAPMELKLHNILTQEVMTDDIRTQLLQVKDIGSAAYNMFRKQRLVEKTLRLSSTIHGTNLQTFMSIHKTKKDGKAKGTLVTQKERSNRQHLVEVARARGSSMEGLLQYSVTPSSYLFNPEGMMKKAVKSALVQELEKSLGKHNQKEPSTADNVHTTFIADMMANVRKMNAKEANTFGELCVNTLNYIHNAAKGANRIDLMFDSYMEMSIKDSERKRRQTIAPIELNMINLETPLPVEMNRFWSSGHNKQKLQMLLHQQAIEQATNAKSKVKLYASHIKGGKQEYHAT